MFKKSNLNSSFGSGTFRNAGFTKTDSPVHAASGFHGGMKKTATTQVVSRVAPKPYSPFYEESNLFMPRDRRETFAWARHFYASDPWVGNAIDLHSTYPLSSFGVKCESLEITKFFNDMLDELNFSTLIYDIAREYYIMGEVFPYCELDEDTGKWSQIIIHNPDYIEVRGNILTTPAISLIPDEELKRLVTSTNPDDILQRQQIPEDVLTYVFAGNNIPLHPAFISQIARKPHPYLVRGTTILTRVFKDLMHRDKIREADITIADRFITPLKIFKVGMPDGTYRPIAEDLANFRDLLEQAMYDPDFTIVTHPGLSVEYVGANGVLLSTEATMNQLEDRILTGLFTSKAFTHGDGPCLSSDTETLTKDGWKFYDEITDKDEIATFNPENNHLEFHHYTGRVKFNIDDELILFKNEKIDHFVSLNHKVWIRDTGKNNIYKKIRADEVRPGYHFKATMEWEGKKEDHIKIGEKNIPINDYMLLVGLYLSEGSVYCSNDKYHKETGLKSKPCGVTISQAKYHKSGLNERYDIIKEILERNYFPTELLSKRREIRLVQNGLSITEPNDLSEGFLIADSDLAKHLLETYGHGSSIKSVPSNIKEYSKEILKSLLYACFLGDGTLLNKNHGNSYDISTISKKMADDLQEIALKCGYACVISLKKRPTPRRLLYRVRIFTPEKIMRGYEPSVQKQDIQKIPYKGWIYCFEVPNHLFVVRRNGKVIVTGNTYSNASVALEVLQQRYESFRTILSKWLEWKVFRPISKINDFHRYNNGVKELIIPKTDWKKINLKNSSEYQNMLSSLVRDNKVSVHSLYGSLDLNYEEEMRHMKQEISDFKEIMYKLQTPYQGKENINVATMDTPEPQQGQPEKEGNEGGDMGGLGGGGGISGGGDGGEGMGEEGGLGDLDLGGEAGPDLGNAAGGEMGGGGTESGSPVAA